MKQIKCRKIKKMIAAAMCVSLLAGISTGCGKDETTPGNQAEQQKGRYTETQVQLPEQLEDWKIKQIFTSEEQIHLLAAKPEDGKTIFSEWELQGDEFKDVTQEWLAGIGLNCGDWMAAELMRDASGAQYFFAGYVENGEEDYKGHLWRVEGVEINDITPQKWKTPDEAWGSYEYIRQIAALDNSRLAVISYTSYDIINGMDGSILESEPISFDYADKLFSDGENIYLYSTGDSGIEIERRANGKSNDATSIVFPDKSGGVIFDVLKDGTLTAGSGEGVFRCKPDSASWEKLLAGAETDFALSDRWCIGMAALEDGRIYALFQESGNIVKLNKYEYDPDASVEVAQELKLYTVYESYLLQQAAVMYHRAHPDVLITIEYEYPRYYYGETDYNAVYQALNTMLMGDDAPDILIMDYLNMDSYASKGLLADINDVISPLEENGELLSNITGAYVREDGKRYAVPLQFGFYLAVGRDITEENMDSIKALAEFLAKADYNYLGSQTVDELVDKFYPYFCEDIVNGKELDKDTLGQYLEYLKAIAGNSGIAAPRGVDESCFSMWDLATEAKLAFEEAEGYNDCMFPMTMADYVQGEYTAFEKSFIPSMQMGVCTKSSYIDTAKDFMRYALSEEIQNTDYYSGFPVNLASLEKQSHADRSEAEAETALLIDGKFEVFQILDYPPETADRLLALCKTLNKPIKRDSLIREVLIEALEGYLNDTQSKEDTIAKIEGGLKMYLAE